MAVHVNNGKQQASPVTNTSTNNTSTTQQATNTNSDLSSLLMEYSIGGFISGEDLLNKVAEEFAKKIPSESVQGIRYWVFKLDSVENDPTSPLAFPTILLVAGNGERLCALPYIFSSMRKAPFDKLRVRLGNEEHELQRLPTEAHDAVAFNYYSTFLDSVGVPRTYDLTTIGVKVISEGSAVCNGDERDFPRAIAELLNPGFHLVTSTLFNQIGGRDLSLVEISRGKKIDISYSKVNDGNIRYDENGLPIGGHIKIDTRIVSNVTNNNDTLNKSRTVTNIGSAICSAAIIQADMYAGPYGNQNATQAPRFTPQLILQDVNLENIRPSYLFLMLASLTPLINPSALMKMVDTNRLAKLNTRAGFTGDYEPLSNDEVVNNLDAVWNALFTQSTVVSMLIRLGSFSGLTTSSLADDVAENVGTQLRNLTHFLSGLNINLPAGLILPKYEMVPIGTYINNEGQERPLQEIDLGYLIEHCPDKVDLINSWALSSGNNVEYPMDYAIKKSVLETVTNGKARIHDRGMLVTFNPQLISTLSHALMSDSNVITNIADISSLAMPTWAPYYGHGAAVSYDNIRHPSMSSGYGSFSPYGHR